MNHTPEPPPSARFEEARQRDYERLFGSGRPGSALLRWTLGPTGQVLFNSPVLRLPENLKLDPSQRFVDVGCARGTLLRTVDARVRFEHPPVGVDFSPAGLARARAEQARSGRPAHYVQGAATALPLQDAAFDIITSGYLVKHLSDEELRGFLDEVHRVLAPGGLALIWDYAPAHDPRIDGWNHRVLGAGVPQPRLRSPKRLLRFAREAGFTEFARNAYLRPFLFPPIPRASILIGKPPEGWTGHTAAD